MKVIVEVKFEIGVNIPLSEKDMITAKKWFIKRIQDNIVDTVHNSRHPFIVESNIDVVVNIGESTVMQFSEMVKDGEMPKKGFSE